MTPAPIPAEEADRLDALHDLDVVGTAPEEPFDALVRAAARLAGAPIALISLVDAHRQWIKASVGLPAGAGGPRATTFCSHAILQDTLFEVPDTRVDPRFADHPRVVGEPGIRFYAAAPVRLSSGARIGALCVIDLRPRRLTDVQRAVLDELALAAAYALEGRRVAMLLGEERRRLAAIVDGMQCGTWEWNVQTGEARFNEQWARMIGWRLDELRPLSIATWTTRTHPDDRRRAESALRRHFDGETEVYDCEVRIRHRDGHWIWVHDRGRVLTRTADGRPGWMYGTHVDVTPRKLQEEALRESRSFLNRTGEVAGVGGWKLDLDAERLVWSDVTCRMHGMPIGTRPTRSEALAFFGPEARARIRTAMERGLAGGEGWDTELPLQPRGGPPIWVRAVGTVEFEDGRPVRMVGAFQDVTEQRRLAGELTWRATHDVLTGLANRGELDARLRRVLEDTRATGREHALLFVDLDQFKLVNDACGHTVGDGLLQQVARLLEGAVRSNDTVARLGGDEFAVILEGCDREAAARIAQQVCDRLEAMRFQHEGQRYPVGASIGLVPIDDRWPTTVAILQAADRACHEAKDAGRNRVHAWLDGDTTIRARNGEMQWATRIAQALDEDRFVLHAQRIEPLGEAAPGIHAEALVRMVERDGTLVPPGAFLPAAERFHLATRIDRWVLRRAIGWLAALPDASAVRLLAINLSGQSVGDRAFHRHAIDLLAGAGAALCRRLCIEITETAAITRMVDAARFIEQLRALGVRVALDDFGAGASSFGYLKTLEVDFLKIDGQFIRDVIDDPLDDAAVRCFAAVARAVGVQTVAEFVDRPEVLAQLRAIGIDHAQGFLMHRPEPIDALLRCVPSGTG